MKNLLLALLGLLCLSSCSDEGQSISETRQADKGNGCYVYPNSPSFKALQSRSGSTFETDWENYQVVNIPNTQPIATPWAQYSTGTGNSARYDVKKEDGWIMVMHTLTEASQIYTNPKYIVLYNQRTGYLRTFYFYEGTNTDHNNDFWYVTFSDPKQAITNATHPVTPPSTFTNNSNYAFTSSLNNGMNSLLCKGWNIMDIPLAYDPELNKNLTMYIGLYSNKTFDVKLYSESIGKAEGSILTDVTTNPFSSIKNSILNASGEAAKVMLGKFAPISDPGLTDLISGGISSIIKQPLNLIFNKLLGGFSKTETTVKTISLTFQEKGQITGSVTAPMRADAVDINLPIGEDKTNIKLGAWNLKEPPTIYMHPVGVLYHRYYGDLSDENDYIFCASGKYKTDIVFNPQLVPHIKNYRIKCTPIYMEPSGFNTSLLPDYPGDATDCGSLGTTTSSSTNINYDCNNDLVTTTSVENNSNDKINIYANNVKQVATIWRLWNKYGKPDPLSYKYDSPVWKYIFAPDNNDLIRGGAFNVRNVFYYLKVTLYAEMEFEGKTFSTMETRTYKPRFEWDPSLVQEYQGLSMIGLQDYCGMDKVLQSIDNGILPLKNNF